MTKDEMDKWTEALRDQGLTWEQTMFAVSLVLEAIHTEREACADIADRYPRIYRETKDAHERLSPEPFLPSNFGFDFAVLHQAERIAHSIRARGQA